ncbi:hypothetical protein Clacol_007408 [Clathrus columnatus]|uniref:Calnexin n=1 Tax=Clathrus columnatus TaxID=1419009 RepID=A0AAV5AEV5_9AGAM|nr:hypothetical protein Clacol_007408 [Clathrus columnatus]
MRRIALSAVALLASSAVVAADELATKFTPTTIKATFLEQFTSSWKERWTPSAATKKTPVGGETFSYVGKWEVEEPSTPIIPNDLGLVVKTKAGHHAISAPFPESISVTTDPLVVQYEAKFQKGGTCGGGYLKLLEEGYEADGEFNDKTPFTLMFGIDMTCPGSKVHFIFRHKNPKTGEYEEKHMTSAPSPSVGKDTKLYTLIIHPNNTYEIDVDGNSVKTGSLLEDFNPPVNPPKEIDDPEDFKPEDWVDEARISDPDATKPADWDEDAPYEIPDMDAVKPEDWLDDEPDMIPDPEAVKPEEWDDEEDGEWMPASIRNPKCDEASGCGEWKRPMKANPDYKGKCIKAIKGVGIEIWTMTEDILFDNIYVGHSIPDARQLAKETFEVKRKIEEAQTKEKDSVLEEEEISVDWKNDPVAFIRGKVIAFFEVAKVDPVLALKTQFNTGAALLAAAFTVLGMVGSLTGLIGSQQKVVTKSAKKSDTSASADKKSDAAPVAPAGGDKTDGPAKKRK